MRANLTIVKDPFVEVISLQHLVKDRFSPVRSSLQFSLEGRQPLHCYWQLDSFAQAQTWKLIKCATNGVGQPSSCLYHATRILLTLPKYKLLSSCAAVKYLDVKFKSALLFHMTELLNINNIAPCYKQRLPGVNCCGFSRFHCTPHFDI